MCISPGSSWCTGKGPGGPAGGPTSPKEQRIRTRPRGQGRTSRPLCSRGGFLTQPFQPARGCFAGRFLSLRAGALPGGQTAAQEGLSPCQVWEETVPGGPGLNCPAPATLRLVQNGRRGFRLPSANPRRDAAGPWSHPLRSDSPLHLPKVAASSAWISRCRCMTC